MGYTDNALTIDEQVELLLGKGMEADPDELVLRLRSVSYHRLSGYWHPYRIAAKDGGDWRFRPQTRLSAIWDRYVFDRQFRLLVFDAIERIEVAIRNDLILSLAIDQGPFGYLEEDNLPGMKVTSVSGNTVYSHGIFLANTRKVVRREIQNANPVVMGYQDKYADGKEMAVPYWMLLEIVDFGTLTRMFHGSPTDVKTRIAHRYGLKKTSIMDSWLDSLRSARNSSGHHQRLWNRKNVLKPEIPNKKNTEWHEPVEIEDLKDRAFGTLTILKYMLGYIAPQSRWASRLESLFAEHPDIDRRLLGYPANWRECPIWAD